jgi:hypothetical protein
MSGHAHEQPSNSWERTYIVNSHSFGWQYELCVHRFSPCFIYVSQDQTNLIELDYIATKYRVTRRRGCAEWRVTFYSQRSRRKLCSTDGNQIHLSLYAVAGDGELILIWKMYGMLVENYGPLEENCFDNIFFKRTVVYILEIQGDRGDCHTTKLQGYVMFTSW